MTNNLEKAVSKALEKYTAEQSNKRDDYIRTQAQVSPRWQGTYERACALLGTTVISGFWIFMVHPSIKYSMNENFANITGQELLTGNHLISAGIGYAFYKAHSKFKKELEKSYKKSTL